MKIENTEVYGWNAAMRAMRNPMNSWAAGDSKNNLMGPKDRDLLKKLVSRGTEHRKVLRMVQVWATVTAPRYWWTEFDTYKIGVTRMSCSTMHKICSQPLVQGDFARNLPVDYLNGLNDAIKAKDLLLVKALLPESFLQKADITANYEVLITMYRQRHLHRLPEWRVFCEWINELPEMHQLLCPSCLVKSESQNQ